MRNPITGKVPAKIRVWFTARGSSPQRPEFVRRVWEDRWIGVPEDCLEPKQEPWSVSSDHGETYDPMPDK